MVFTDFLIYTVFLTLEMRIFFSKYSTGTPEALFEAFQTEINTDKSIKLNVTKLMNTWTRQSGFPAINAELIGNTVKLSQKRFYLRSSQNLTSKALWSVPINWATRSDPNFLDTKAKEYLQRNFKSVEIKNVDKDWVIFNVQQTGKKISSQKSSA